MKPFAYRRAADAREAIAAARQPDTRLVAGGTDLLREMKLGLAAPDTVVDVSRVAAWSALRVDARSGLRAGGAVTLAALEESAAVTRLYPALHQAIAGAATPQVRNRATLAGSLLQRPSCWYYRGGFDCLLGGGGSCSADGGDNRHGGIFAAGPCVAGHPSDPAAALIALGSSVALASAARGKRTVPVEALFAPPTLADRRETRLRPGEAITGLTLPPPAAGARSIYLRARDRSTWAFALVGLALALRLERGRVRDLRLVAAGVAPIPFRLPAAEDVVRGRKVDPGLAGKAGAAAVAAASPDPTVAYKVPILQALVARALLALAS